MPIENLKTEFTVEVVKLGEIEKHPNADSLGITSVHGYPCIVKLGTFQPGDLAVYVPVDSLVDTSRPEFSFLARESRERHRIRAIRLRGVFSMGLLVSPQPEWKVGQNVQTELGIDKYIPPSELRLAAHEERVKNARRAKYARPDFMPIYGLDGFRRFSHVLEAGEEVVITEKIHGTNARYCVKNGRLFVGSHKVLKGATRHIWTERLNRLWLIIRRKFGFHQRTHILEDLGDVWWNTAQRYELFRRLEKHPNVVIYGEIYGEKVQALTYDSPRGQKLRLFDAFDFNKGRYLPYDEFRALAAALELPTVPELYRGPWQPELIKLAEGTSTLGKHIREGVVIKPAAERWHPKCGRVALKLVSEQYLLDEKL